MQTIWDGLYYLLYAPFLLGKGLVWLSKLPLIFSRLIVSAGISLLKQVWQLIVTALFATISAIKSVIKLFVAVVTSLVSYLVTTSQQVYTSLQQGILRAISKVLHYRKPIIGRSNRQPINRYVYFGIVAAVSAGLITTIIVIGQTAIANTAYPSSVDELQHPRLIKITDTNQVELFSAFEEEPKITTFLPEVLAISLIEQVDPNFYHHQGITLSSVAAAIKHPFVSQQDKQTITEQLAKKSLVKKTLVVPDWLHHYLLTIKLEQTYTKNELLALYAATTQFGSASGAENAAKLYFNKSITELSPAEQVMLAAIAEENFTSQSLLLTDYQIATRYNLLVESLSANDKLAAYQSYFSETPLIDPAALAVRSPNAVGLVLAEISATSTDHELISQPVTIQTSIDLAYQNQLQQMIVEQATSANLAVPQTIVMIVDQNTGDITALLGKTVNQSVTAELLAASTASIQASSITPSEPIHVAQTYIAKGKHTALTPTASNQTIPTVKAAQAVSTSSTGQTIIAVWQPSENEKSSLTIMDTLSDYLLQQETSSQASSSAEQK